MKTSQDNNMKEVICVMKSGTLALLALAVLSVSGAREADGIEKTRAKFEPPDGRVLHGWGQHIYLYESEAVPYMRALGKECVIISDYMELTLMSGITQEMIALAKRVFPKLVEGMTDGMIKQLIQAYNTTPARFAEFRKRSGKQYIPLIGISWRQTNDKNIAEGQHDEQIQALAAQVKKCDFPVFLRPGFEFGPYGYMEKLSLTSREHYAKMFRHFVEIFRSEGVQNAAFVWNTVGVEAYDYWMDYYPGDEYVDWWGVNLFSRGQIVRGDRFLQEAKKRGKPVMICESAPAFEGGTQSEQVIDRFFAPYFELIERHSHIKAFVYINIDWAAQKGAPFAHWPDSRIQSNPKVLEFYKSALSNDRFIHLPLLTEEDAKMGNTYYVDATNGMDSNDGLSSETSWETVAKVNSMGFDPGDSVLFKRGEVWREQLIPQSGSETGYVRYGAYGTGDKPLLLGSVTRNNADDWKHEGGNIWSTYPPEVKAIVVGDELLSNPSFDTDADKWYLHYENGANALGNRDTTVHDSPPASYRIECIASGKAANHIQFYTTGIGITNGCYYKLSFRARSTQEFAVGGISLMKEGSPWSSYASYHTNHSPTITTNWATYEVLFKANITASDGRITFSLGGRLPQGTVLHIDTLSFRKCKEDDLLSSGDLLSVDVGNIIFNNEESVGVKVWEEEDLDCQGKFWYNENNRSLSIYSESNPASYYSSIECALRKHIIDEGGKSYVIYENLALRYGGAHGIGGGSTHHIIVRDCDVSYIGGGDQRGGDETVRYGNGVEFWSNAHDNLVERCRLWEIYDAALTNQGSGKNSQVNICYRDNIIWNCEYSFEYWNRDEDSITHNIRFENNTCANAGFGWGHGQRSDPNGRHLMFYHNTAKTTSFHVCNNIFYEATESCLRLGNDWTSALTMDYNCWYQSAGTMIKWLSDEYTMAEFSAYQTEKGKDKHSIAADPLFVDEENHDFRLTAGSPADDMSGAN